MSKTTDADAPKKSAKKPAKAAGAKKTSAKKTTTSTRARLAGKTTIMTPATVPAQWLLIDLENQSLGRIASRIAEFLRGKHKVAFHPSQDLGDFVIAVNADKIRLTGNKAKDKLYYRHSGYLGSLKSTSAGVMLAEDPDKLLRLAVKRMLPPTNLGNNQLKRLFVYAGKEHPHKAQKVEPATLN